MQANEAVSNAEAEVGRFDTIFQDVEQEHQAATQALNGVRMNFEQIKEQESEIKGRVEEGMKERHDLQVCVKIFKTQYVSDSHPFLGTTT